MRNPYKTITKDMSNASQIIAQREGDYVYITTGYWAVKIYNAVYNEWLRPDCMRLIPMEDGDKIISRDKKQQCEKCGHDMNIKELFDKTEKVVEVETTPLKIEIKGKKMYDARILKTEQSRWIISEVFFQIAKELQFQKVFASKDNGHTPLMFDAVDTQLLIMPIRGDSNADRWLSPII